jgi:MFS family permease
MYAVRKPFSALVYDHLLVWGVNVKIWMVLAQLLGYTLSKFYGIRMLGKIKHEDRSIYLIAILSLATIPLYLLQFLPPTTWPLLMLFNGFPLGLVWGIVFSYVEGRKYTELIGAMLACTFVFSSGWVKTFGLYLQNALSLQIQQVPFFTALIALIAAAFVILILEKLPPPNAEDLKLRNARKPMTATQQQQFLRDHGPILIPFVTIYGIFTIMRDFRDNFTAEMLIENGAYSREVFTNMELAVSLVLLCLIPLFSWIKNHQVALNTTTISIIIGVLTSIAATILFDQQRLSIVGLLMFTGGGFYLGYILINISVMDRIVGFSGESGNSGFLIYIADSVGYLFSLIISSFALLNKLDSVRWTSLYLDLIIVGSCLIFILALFIPYQLQKKKSSSNHAHIITT